MLSPRLYPARRINPDKPIPDRSQRVTLQQNQTHEPAGPDRKTEWTKPEVNRMAAGSAENGLAGDIDAGDSQS